MAAPGPSVKVLAAAAGKQIVRGSFKKGSVVQPGWIRKQLAVHGGEAIRPQPRNDGTPRWLRPVVSRRKWKMARKQAIVAGTYGTFDPFEGGWLPEWDEVREPFVPLPFKGHKRQRTRAARAAKIDEKMKEMPDKIAAYRQWVKDRKPVPGVETLWKKYLAFSQGRRR